MSPFPGMNGDTANSREGENAGSVDPHHSNHDPFKIAPKGPTERLKEWRAVERFERAGRSADQDEAPAGSGVGPKTVVNLLQDRKVTDLDKLGGVTGYLGQLYAIPKLSSAQLLAFVFMALLVKGSGDQTQADSSSDSAVDKNRCANLGVIVLVVRELLNVFLLSCSWTDPQIAGVVVPLLAFVIGSIIVPCCLFWWKERREERREEPREERREEPREERREERREGRRGNVDVAGGLSNPITGTDERPLPTHARECQTQVLPAIADNTVTSDTITLEEVIVSDGRCRECQTQVLPAIADNTVTSDTITNLAV